MSDGSERRLRVHDRPRLPERPGPVPVTGPLCPDRASALRAARGASRVVLAGGEPTLLADLPDRVRSLAAFTEVVLETDGLSLGAPGAAELLRAAGLAAVRVPFPSARPDAHDHLAGRRGVAARRTKALRAARAAGLTVEADVPLTRPTVAHLPETVRVLLRLGVTALRVRRPRIGPPPLTPELALSLSPRLHGLPGPLAEAGDAARAGGVPLHLSGVPRCFAPAAASGLVRLVDAEPARAGCARCPGPPACGGIPADYEAVFGRSEFDALGGAEPPSDPVRVAFEPGVDSRRLRLRLVHAASRGGSVLRIDDEDSCAHPDAAELLRDACRLSFARVELGGPIGPLARLDDRAFGRLRGLGGVEGLLLHPSAEEHDRRAGRPGDFDATLDVVHRFSTVAQVPAVLIGRVESPSELAAWQQAWDGQRLPGPPGFVLAPSASGTGLAAAVDALPAGPTREALRRLLVDPAWRPPRADAKLPS